MALKRPKRAFRPPGTRKKSDSSQHRRKTQGAEESRLFKADPLRGVRVAGRVSGWSVPKAALAKVLKSYLAALGLPAAGVELQLVGDAACQQLNREHRQVDAPTDVLSFPAESTVRPGFDGYLGELALDLPYAWRKRGRFHPRFEGEASFLLLHGLLHLTGVHHDTPAQERALWRLQDRYFPPAPALLAGLRALRPKAR